MCKGYIYRHWIVNEDDVEKSYVGQTIKTLAKRWDKGRGYTRNGKTNKFANAIEKHGWDNFNHDILLTIECETKEELLFWLNEWEKYYIEEYDSFRNGYNMTLGGEGTVGCIPSEETRVRLSEATKGEKNGMYGKSHTEESRKAMSENHADVTGEKNPNYGREAWNRTKIVCLTTKEIFDSIEQAQEKYKCGDGIGQCCKGKRKSCGKHPITGEKLTWAYLKDYENMAQEEINKRLKAKRDMSNAKTVICLETLEVFDGINEASRKYKIDSSSITKCCKGKYKTCGGYHWMYYSDYLEQQNKENSDTSNN